MKEDLIKRLVDEFKKETEKYSNLLDGVVNYKCEEFFKKNNPEKGYHSVDSSIMFKNFTLKLEYKVNISMLIPKSTVEMRFVFEKGKLPVEYSIYDLLGIIDESNFKCYTFAYVTSENKMQEVLMHLIDTFIQYKEKIEELSINDDKLLVLEKNIDEKIVLLLDEKVFESRNAFYLMHMLELYYVLDTSRFTMDVYLDYLNGKYKKAIKKYNKLGESKLTDYEKRLVKYLNKTVDIRPVEDELNTLLQAKKLKNIKTELLPMYFSWLILTPLWFAVYGAIFYIALYLLSRGAIYVGGAQLLMVFLPAFITAIINSYFLRRLMYKLFFRKSYDKIVALDEIENSEKTTNIMSKLFQFVIALGIIVSILAANTNIAFYDNSFNNNLKLLDIKGKLIRYEDVYCVYKANAMKNDFDEIVNNPTYVIVLKGGEQINLYFYMEFEEVRENIIPIFERHNIEIREIDFVEKINVSND